jgi:FkbM family methyltransferase
MNKKNIIQIGCNVCNDAVTDIIKQNDINKFIVVDAQIECINVAKDEYSFLNEKLITVCAAIGDKNGVTNFFIPANLPLSGHSSLSRKHLEQHDHKDIKNIYVPILNINTFLESLNLDTIDLLYMDTEGFDAIILLEMDFKVFQPKQIIYEFMHSDGKHTVGEKHNRLVKKFIDNGYRLIQISPENILAEKQI